MFERFCKEYLPDGGTSLTKISSKSELKLDGDLAELLDRFGGTSFNGGMYRIISANELAHWNELIGNTFPIFNGQINCFGVDWLGRIFALDARRAHQGGTGVVMLQPGTAEVLEIPSNIVDFHDIELVEYQEEALAKSFYRQWLASGGQIPQHHQCIGYKKPLFLGGDDTVNNLELSDLNVYWVLASQLIRKVRDLPVGTNLDKISFFNE